MRRARSGFTLFELMIVVAIIGIIAAIAIPNLLSARRSANEASAVSTLRSISTAQAQFQAAAKCDVDGDGLGEFGLFRELSGVAAVRTAADGSNAGGTRLNPSVLSPKFGNLDGLLNAYISSAGYRFDMILPGAGGLALHELPTTFAADTDTDLCETTWCCYAAPMTYENSGVRTFFINQKGEITAKDDPDRAIGAGHAFRAGGSINNITGSVAVGTVGRDGFTWKPVN